MGQGKLLIKVDSKKNKIHKLYQKIGVFFKVFNSVNAETITTAIHTIVKMTIVAVFIKLKILLANTPKRKKLYLTCV